MTLTPSQQRIVEENMGLVGKVIKDKVHGIGQYGVSSYDDLFQIGCIGLCKAAATDKGGCFSTYAYRLIWNEICDELIRMTRQTQQELAVAPEDIPKAHQTLEENPLLTSELRYTLEQAKARASGTTAKGVKCLELSIHGYSSQEIGKLMGAEAATIRMWMTKARRFLREQTELQDYIVREVA